MSLARLHSKAELRSPWRNLNCLKQALLTLAHLRKNETFAQAGAGLEGSESTAWCYVDETLEVLGAGPTRVPTPSSAPCLPTRRSGSSLRAVSHNPRKPHGLRSTQAITEDR
ncbi:transposase family protein [Streptomyces massasporeus]|uniref:Transposase family protein n=1 Tax=Streptomyces massasporeus TaxID=67324 RepID=A0ABW6LAA5_9ACTN